MILLRNFTYKDSNILCEKRFGHMSFEEIENMISEWNTKIYEGKYFEMFGIFEGEKFVGLISLFSHSESVISVGVEILEDYRNKGFAKEAMLKALEIAKNKGYKISKQQVRKDNIASISLHNSLGFETDGYIYKNKKSNEILIYLKAL